MQQALASSLVQELKTALTEKRIGYEEAVKHMERRHEKQRKQLVASQERRIAAERNTTDLETRHLSEEIRNSLIKNLQERINYNKVVDKRVNEHLREVQRLELKHAREQFDYE